MDYARSISSIPLIFMMDFIALSQFLEIRADASSGYSLIKQLPDVFTA
jgi:hypothetical protein